MSDVPPNSVTPPKQKRPKGRPKSKDKNDPRTLAILEDKAEAVRLRGEEKLSYQQIAQRLGLSVSVVYNYVNEKTERLKNRILDYREAYATIQLEEIDKLIQTAYQQLSKLPDEGEVKDRVSVVRARADLIRTINTLLERQAKLLGLDAPTQIQHMDETPTAIVFNVLNAGGAPADDAEGSS